ncbi:MAG: type II toxin-antitoxin system PemK/MazF family toxin [Planctomycetes bacterium]|nr:type II toxin-antitoxin system PemK/MazF family toxin [Planctomycetota bacterium]
MPNTTSYEFGEVLLVPFPFTDLSGAKRRPAVVVSGPRYNEQRPDIIIMAVSSQVATAARFGEVSVGQWREAGLLHPSLVKPVLATIHTRIILRQLGRLREADRQNLATTLRAILDL